jgi:hypothetical protein
MAIWVESHEDCGLIKNDPLTVICFVLGSLFVISGFMLIRATPPNFQVGFLLLAVGFALFAFDLYHYSNARPSRKLHEISEKLDKSDALDNNLKK